MLDWLLANIAPHHCLNCQKNGQLLCERCKNNILQQDYLHCLNCSQALDEKQNCKSCRLPYRRVFVLGDYNSSLGALIRAMKFNYAREAIVVLADLAARFLPDLPENLQIVPLPTSSVHRRQRGFAHMEQIARRLAKAKKVTYRPILQRRHNLAQIGATKLERQKQALSAYKIKGKVDKDQIFLLIDDVSTTGSSLRAAIKILRAAGAKQIWVLVFAHDRLD